MEATENYYLINHLVLITGLTDRTIRNYISNGILHGEKINGLWHFTSEEVESFIAHPAVRPSILAKHNSAVYDFLLGQFTRNYTQTVKRAADNKRRYAPGWVHSTCLLRGFPKGAAPHLAHDFAEQSVVCYTLCRRCPENTVAAGEGKGI